ncbi:MAG: RIP metalloprotease RseP [Pseudomonadota bacterium]
MDFLISGGNLIIGTIIPFLIVLTIVVFFHELGHYLAARWNGVGIEKFAVGFGPDIWGFTDRAGTRWAVSAIPLGGYVKFIDDDDATSFSGNPDAAEQKGADPSTFFANKKLWQRAIVVAAGPIANFILAIVIFALLFGLNGRQILSPQVDQITEQSVAERAGFQTGDLITAVDGRPIERFQDLQRVVTVNADNELVFSVLRSGETITINATPELVEIDDGFGGTMRVGRLGITRSSDPSAIVVKHYGPIEAVAEGVNETWYVVTRTYQFLGGLITGRESVDQLGGPIRIAEVSGQVAAISIVALISLTAVLSVSIGIMNLLPIPVLDGGHLVLYAIEAVRGKPLSKKTMDLSFRIGLAFVLCLMVAVTTLDINRIIERLL